MYQANKRYLEEWINVPSKCDDSFTALHFASFFGNFFLIKYLISQGADPWLRNQCDINMLHVAA
jgi:ankyrin repeat protein